MSRLAAGTVLALALCFVLARGAHADPPLKPPGDTPLIEPQKPVAEKPRSGWAVLPIGSYSPETQLGLGLFGTHFFRLGDATAQTRPSSLSAVGLYTWRQQVITELIPELYWNHMRSHVWTRLDYRRYPNELWAVGNGARESSEESYTEDRLRWQGTYDHELSGPLRVEGKLEVVGMSLRDVRPGGLLDTGAVPGSNAGRTIGIGPGLLWDTRDHLLVPRHGELLEASIMGYSSLIGSQHDYAELLVDLRLFLPVLDSHVIAFQLFSQVQVGKAPFYDLPQLGGQDLLRGFFEGRFRDESLLAVQGEYRLPLFWRFSGVAHAALGQVARDPWHLSEREPKWSLGPGLRILLNTDEKLNLRADLGVCKEGYGLYVGIAEAY